MYLPRFSHFILFLAVFVLVVLGAHWFNGYDKAKGAGADITYWQYVRTQISQANAGLKELPAILKEGQAGSDNAVRGSLLKISQALEMYNSEAGAYPDKISDLLGDYLNERNNLIKQDAFFYKRTYDGGYELSIILPVSREEYVIRK